MKLLQILKLLIGIEPKEIPGLIPDGLDPRDVYVDEILGGVATFPQYHLTADTKFKPQGKYPFCVAFAICRLAEWIHKTKTGEDVTFSEPHLFFNGGGTRIGSSVRNLLEYARQKGFILQNELPMPENVYDTSAWDDLKRRALAFEPDGKYKISGYARVTPTQMEITKAIINFGEVLVSVVGSSGYVKNDKSFPVGRAYDHITRWIGFKYSDFWNAIDSLRVFGDGQHTFDWDYPPGSAYVILDLPTDWKEQRDTSRQNEFPNNAGRYGLPRRFDVEVSFAKEMNKKFHSFNNQSVYEAAGRFWEMYIRAGVYGGYTLTDLVNDCYNWRRTGKHIFDFDKSNV